MKGRIIEEITAKAPEDPLPKGSLGAEAIGGGDPGRKPPPSIHDQEVQCADSTESQSDWIPDARLEEHELHGGQRQAKARLKRESQSDQRADPSPSGR